MIDEEQREPHWFKTVSLAKVTLVFLVITFLIPVFFTSVLDQITFLGFPAGFYFLAQAAPLLLAAFAFWFVRKQDAIDRQYGASEEI